MPLTLNPAVLKLQPSPIRSFTQLVKDTPGALALTIGEPDQATPENIRAEVTASLCRGETHYPPNNGYPWLLKEIADYEARQHRLHYDPEEIIVTAGATEALFVSLMTVLEPGDEVIIPTPAFGLYASIVTLLGGVPVFVPTIDTQFQPSADAIRAAVTKRTKAIILNSPNNPSGAVFTDATLDKLHALLARSDFYLLSDEVYRDLSYCPGGAKSLAEYPDLRDKSIVIQSFSKPWAMTGWRVGWVMAPAAIRERMRYVHQFDVVSVPSFVQSACVTALRTDVAPMRELYRSRRDLVLARLHEMGLPVQKPEGAFYVLPDFRAYCSDSTAFAERLLKEALLGLVPGSAFGAEGFLRLSYCYSDETLTEGLNRLERFLAAQKQDR